MNKFDKTLIDEYTKVKQTLETINRRQNTIIATCRDLLRTQKENDLYQSALTFITWFDWDKITSDKLRNEAKNKLISDVKVSGVITGSVDSYGLDHIYDEEQPSRYGVLSSAYPSSYSLEIKDDYFKQNAITTLRIGDTEIKLGNKPKHEYSEYVKALVANPFKYSKTDVYNVAEYLKEIINTNSTVNKYSNY